MQKMTDEEFRAEGFIFGPEGFDTEPFHRLKERTQRRKTYSKWKRNFCVCLFGRLCESLSREKDLLKIRYVIGAPGV